ncbi:solute carrier family 52, riboflavin transporter, member 3-A-like isoform X2 [Sitodiplosis mosellana]|nr:solute carrier family 52, riboflavin transporter, member 3-A-like isoform X2 [Sitodiplosis mosellana]XP_055325458.1 solute carrier family 52, riboflavin transporter, member 3-A-like isoform X2 [Sitodiplosis mosellana]
MAHESTEAVIKPVRKRNIFVDALAILFGVSSWIGVTSTYLQLPLLVSSAPEGWSLPSYIAIAVQIANIGSFAYVVYQKYSPKKIDDGFLIYFTLTIGCVAAICMAFFYQHTIEISGHPYSVFLLLFTLMFALVGCLSSVLFMPYMGRFRECYLVSYMFGMGLNGFVSSVLALIQGVGGPPECVPSNTTDGGFIEKYPPPLFGIRLYFEFVFGILVLSTVAFILLNKLSTCKKEYAAGTIGMGNEYHYDHKEDSDETKQNIPADVLNLSTFNYIFLMAAVVGLSGLGNGIFPGLMSYSCLPYGNQVYHLSVTLAAIANPCAGFIAMFLSHTSIRVIRFLSFIGSILAIYLFYIALQSPNPPLKDSMLGYVLIVSSWTIFTCIINYMKLSIVSIFRYQEGRSLVWVGTVNQISSAVGATISFVLVNYTKIFVEASKC